jgi:hypothetical protein
MKFPDGTKPCKATIHNIITNLCPAESMQDKNKHRKRRVLTEEKLDDIGTRVERRPKKFLRLVIHQCGFAKSTAHVAIEFLKLEPYKTIIVHPLLVPDSEARICYCGWFQESTFNELLDPEDRFYSGEKWFTLSGYLSSQNNRHWSTEYPHAVHEVPLRDLGAGGWCAEST